MFTPYFPGRFPRSGHKRRF